MRNNEEKYYILSSDEDGISIQEFENVSKLEKYIEENYNPEEVTTPPVFLDAIPDIDKGCFIADERALIIIKGKIIVPKPVKVVSKYEIE